MYVVKRTLLFVDRKAVFLKKTRAATAIQANWRCYRQRQVYIRARTAIITIQVGCGWCDGIEV